jgi:hypothetical protein
MENRFLIIVCLVFLLSKSVLAQSIQISPMQFELSAKAYEQKCEEIHVSPDEDLIVQIRWSENKSINPQDYREGLFSEEVEVSLNQKKRGLYEFCFKGKKEGVYFGAIFFRNRNSLLSMATKLTLSINGTETLSQIKFLTGEAVQNVKDFSDGKELFLLGGFLATVALLFWCIGLKPNSL